MKIPIDFRTQLDVSGLKRELIVRYCGASQIRTFDELKHLVTCPSFTDALVEATRLKQVHGIKNADAKTDAAVLKEAYRNVFRSPERGLLGIPEEILKSIMREVVVLYRLRATRSALHETLDQHAQIDFNAMREMSVTGKDELPLRRGASLHRLSTITGVDGFGTFGYYNPVQSIFLLIPADIEKRTIDALHKHHQSV